MADDAQDGIQKGTCLRCGMTGRHENFSACIDGLRNQIAVLEFRLGKKASHGHNKDCRTYRLTDLHFLSKVSHLFLSSGPIVLLPIGSIGARADVANDVPKQTSSLHLAIATPNLFTRSPLFINDL